MAQKNQQNMIWKIVIAVVIIAVLFYLFRGYMGGAPAPTQPSAPTEPTTPTEAEGSAAEDQPTTQAAKQATKEATVVTSMGLDSFFNNIFCDYSDNIITFNFKNILDREVAIYKGELTTEIDASRTIRISINGRWTNPNLNRGLDCGDPDLIFAPGQSARCTASSAVLRPEEFDTRLTGQHGQNRIRAETLEQTPYGLGSTIIYFVCQP